MNQLFRQLRIPTSRKSPTLASYALPVRPPYLNHRQQQRRLLRLRAFHRRAISLETTRVFSIDLYNELSATIFRLPPASSFDYVAPESGFSEQFACFLKHPSIGCILPDWLPQCRTVWDWLSAANLRDRKHVLACCRIVGLDDWLNELPMGPMTLQLSPQLSFTPHERERLLLAVAFLQKPRILLWQDCGLTSEKVTDQLVNEFCSQGISVIRIHEPMPAHWLPWQVS